MKLRIAILLMALATLVFGCTKAPIQTDNPFPLAATKIAQDHGVAIAVYYYMGETEYRARVEAAKKARIPLSPYYLETMFPLGRTIGRLQHQDEYTIAYLGAGGIIGKNHVLTVRHLFVHDANTTGSRIFVIQRDANMAIDSELVAISEGKVFHDDYAVIKMSVDLGLPGIKLSPTEGIDGEPIIVVGSTGGLAFHTRYLRLTHASRYFNPDEQGILHLSWWDDFELTQIFPGGPGDSGGIVLNSKGELIAIDYCGLEIYAEEYIFGNPIRLAWDFLKANKLDGLVR